MRLAADEAIGAKVRGWRYESLVSLKKESSQIWKRRNQFRYAGYDTGGRIEQCDEVFMYK